MNKMNKNTGIYDISPLIDFSYPVWPNDTPLTQKKLFDIEKGDHMTLSSIMSTVHLGAHVDAPSHFIKGGLSIDSLEIEKYIGECQVIEISLEKGEVIKPSHILVEVFCPRILLRTATFDHNVWNNNFSFLSEEIVDFLAEKGVFLIGVDTPSVDHFDSKDFLIHKKCYRNDIAIIEGLELKNIEARVYELVALPLKIYGFEASPVRAILREISISPKGKSG